MTVTPLAELAQFLNFGVDMLNIILLRQACRVVYADITAKPEENSGCLVCQQLRVGSSAIKSVTPYTFAQPSLSLTH